MDKYIKAAERLYAKSTKIESGCWISGHARRGKNCPYPAIKVGKKVMSGHRVSWIAYNKQEIPGGMVIMHRCNAHFCVNPKHLSVGTYSENNKNAWEDGLVTPNNKPIGVINIDTGKKFFSLGAAGAWAGVNKTAISNAAKGLVPRAGGYRWEFLNV